MALPKVNGEFRVAADPELRFAPSGVAVGKLRAVATKRKKVNDEWVDDKTAWVNLTGFNKIAENMAESFQKGDLVVVVGELQVDDWEDKEGNKRTTVNIIVDTIGPSVSFNPAIAQRTERGSGGGGGGGQRPPAQEDPWATPAEGQTEEPPF